MIAKFYGGPRDGETRKLTEDMPYVLVARLGEPELPPIRPMTTMIGTYRRGKRDPHEPLAANVWHFMWEGWGA